MGDKRKMTETTKMIKAIANDSKVRIDRIVANYEQLEKENAELKSENQKWKDEWQEQVQKATDEGYARTLQTIQLTKATEIIKKLYAVYYDPCVTESDLKYRDELFAEIKQFLSEVEK